jgi:hypothetical protein
MTSTTDLMHLAMGAIWNENDLELVDVLCTSDYVNHGGPSFGRLEANEAGIASARVARGHRRLVDSPDFGSDGVRGITRCRLRIGKSGGSWTTWDRRTVLAELS